MYSHKREKQEVALQGAMRNLGRRYRQCDRIFWGMDLLLKHNRRAAETGSSSNHLRERRTSQTGDLTIRAPRAGNLEEIRQEQP